jgi:CheY-like chemotaxis protein
MNRLRILIIDDDVSLTMVMKINLEATKRYEVRVVNQALEALSEARDFLPDLILLDVVMPDLDGGDISSMIKADPGLAKIPIVMVTALVSNDETGEDASVYQGGQTMVPKPVRFDKLLEVIENQLAKV